MKIFITGISSGIGRSLCKELIYLGHTVWGIARKENLLKELKENLNSNKFFYNVCNTADEIEVKKVAEEMRKVNFLPDVVVLNAAVEKKDFSEDYQNKITREVFDVNFFGALIWVEMFIKKFIERGYGQFIAISSIFAKRPDIDSVSYCASKSALSMAFRSLNLHYIKRNIIFKNIYFGPVDTDISSSYRSSSTKKSFFVISPETAAKCIIKAMKGEKLSHYFPFLVALPVRLTSFLSDLIFFKITRFFRR